MGIFSRRASTPIVDMDELAVKIAGLLPAPVPATLDTSVYGAGYAWNPGVPLPSQSIDPRNPVTGRPDPRRSEFPNAVNLQVTSTRFIPFQVLRDCAERVDVIRRCIEVRKAHILSLDWDIRISKEALSSIMESEKVTSPGKAAEIARERFAPEINRLRKWWKKPDRFNQQNFSTWLGLLLEEQLVLDAVTVWPRRQMNGDVQSFEILDGSTIKPLLDHRGATPLSPNPAYQQILYGFPRGDFTAADSDDPNGYTFDQIVYRPRYIRTWTPYGCPNVEGALAAADIYLKRMAWIRGEFDEGTTPDQWLTNKALDSKMTPSGLKDFERALNDEMAGADAERRHLHMLPPGWVPTQMKNFSELYKAELDEFTIKLICMCFDVMPTEIGFTPNQGLGGKGHQEGEANSAQRKDVRPTVTFLEDLLSDLSRDYLGMSDELEFKFDLYNIENQDEDEKVADSQIRRGGIVLNEDRAARGLPMYDMPEADEPFIMTPAGIVFIRGALSASAGATTPEQGPDAPVTIPPPTPATPSPAAGADVPESGDPIAADAPVPDGFVRVAGHLRAKPAVNAEAAKFVKFATARQGKAWRDFKFEEIDRRTALELNACGESGNLELVRAMVADLGKAKARRVSRAAKDKLVADHSKRIAGKVAALFPSPADLVSGFTATKDDTPSQAAARKYVEEQMGVDYDPLDQAVEDFIMAGHDAAWEAAWITDGSQPDTADKVSTALDKLRDAIPDVRDVLIGLTVGAVASAILSDNPEANTATVIDDHATVDDFAGNELTGALAAGTLDASQQQQIFVVQIVASTGDCEFCQGYDGRILHIDETEGMPPLHNGCGCDIEPLEPLT